MIITIIIIIINNIIIIIIIHTGCMKGVSFICEILEVCFSLFANWLYVDATINVA